MTFSQFQQDSMVSSGRKPVCDQIIQSKEGKLENYSEAPKDYKDTALPKYVKPYVTVTIILGIVIMLMVGTAMIWISFDKAKLWPFYMLREIGKAIFLTVLVSAAINWYFKSQLSIIEREKQESEKLIQARKERYEREKDVQFRETVNQQLNTLREEVLRQRDDIADKAVCFDELQAADVDSFYRNRSDASRSIKNMLLQKGIASIKLIGISLNDFMRDEHTELHDAWMQIRRYAEEDTPPAGAESLDIKVLVIDPRSNGANSRARAEATEGTESRLYNDVGDAMRDLYDLEQRLSLGNPTGRRVAFQARVYRTCPILFLAWTPHTAFVQPYHFRPRHSRSRIPTIKYHNSGETDCMHQELGFHFDWIWNNASVTLDDHLNRSCIGIDDAVRDSRIANMYYDYDESRARIIRLMEETNRILWIKGISLHSYFTFTRDELFRTVVDAYERGVDVRILLINPNCEQAKLRSFREYLMSHPNSRIELFDERARQSERLFTDTTGVINFIKLQLRRRIKPGTELNVRLYHSGPECFTLVTDHSVLVEQYHYGKIVDSADETQPGLILGGDIPVLEYAKVPEDQLVDRKKNPYQLFKDSFDYVFNHCSIDLEEYHDSGATRS